MTAQTSGLRFYYRRSDRRTQGWDREALRLRLAVFAEKIQQLPQAGRVFPAFFDQVAGLHLVIVLSGHGQRHHRLIVEEVVKGQIAPLYLEIRTEHQIFPHQLKDQVHIGGLHADFKLAEALTKDEMKHFFVSISILYDGIRPDQFHAEAFALRQGMALAEPKIGPAAKERLKGQVVRQRGIGNVVFDKAQDENRVDLRAVVKCGARLNFGGQGLIHDERARLIVFFGGRDRSHLGELYLA